MPESVNNRKVRDNTADEHRSCSVTLRTDLKKQNKTKQKLHLECYKLVIPKTGVGTAVQVKKHQVWALNNSKVLNKSKI